MMKNFNWKEFLLLACILIAGCCDTFDSYDFPIRNPNMKEIPSNDMDIRAIRGGDL